MRHFVVALAVLAGGCATVKVHQPLEPAAAAQPPTSTPITVVASSVTVNGPESPQPIVAAQPTTSTPSALCRDGAYSYSRHRSGTCSWHGGVAQWLVGQPPQ